MKQVVHYIFFLNFVVTFYFYFLQFKIDIFTCIFRACESFCIAKIINLTDKDYY